jgi:predicted phosphodiesterase
MRRKLAWSGAVLGGLALLSLALCGILNLALGGFPMAPSVNLADLGTPPPSYQIAVLGDSQKGLANFDRLLAAVKGARLILHTGDLVSTNDEGHYRLVALHLQRAALSAPFIVVPGNHDVKHGPERFQREFGPLERAIPMGDVVLLTIDNSSGAPPDIKRVEARIAQAGPHKAVMLAMHIPPFNLQGAPLPEYLPFLQWLEQSGVKYLFCGHIHTYLRKQVGETIVIMNGVGGDYDSWQFDQNACATLLDIEGRRISDRKIEFPPEHGFMENLNHFAIGHVAETVRRHPALCWCAVLLLATLVGFSMGILRQPARISLDPPRERL